MTSSDQRLDELLGRWVRSLELHLRYSALTDEAYWQVQPWPKHSRPARWIIEHALASAKDLQRIVQQRRQQGDEPFAGALELMGFVANLVGVQNIERFIPLADPERENREVAGQTASTLQPLGATSTQLRPSVEATREMPAPQAVHAELDDPSARPALRRPSGDTSTMAAPYRIEDTRVDAARPAVPAPSPVAAPTAPPAARPPAPAPPAGTPAGVQPAAGPYGASDTGRHPAVTDGQHAARTAASEAASESGRQPAIAAETSAPPAAATDATADTGRNPAIGAETRAPPAAATDATADTGRHPAVASGKNAPRASTPAAGSARTPAAKAPPARAPASKATGEGRRAAPRREPRGTRAVPDAVAKIVIADAVRLRKWGREWHELAESISRMAGRPNLTEVRRILRVHKADIDEDAGHGDSGKHRRR
jgi:hypothetical protein